MTDDELKYEHYTDKKPAVARMSNRTASQQTV